MKELNVLDDGFLLLVAMPFAPSSVLAPSSDGLLRFKNGSRKSFNSFICVSFASLEACELVHFGERRLLEVPSDYYEENKGREEVREGA